MREEERREKVQRRNIRNIVQRKSG